MTYYLSIIKESFSWFPLIAAILTIPYVIHNYHKYGSVFSFRIVIIYSFVLYLMTAYFLVILPLPDRETVAQMTSPKIQPIPLNFIFDIIKENRKTGITLIRNKALLQFIFNILMTTPFGMYLHYYFEYDLKKTLKYSFLLSLFFELTQLSGLYFYYPRPYRLFDPDDLLANSLGGILGYYLVIPLLHFLPKREEIDDISIKRGHQVSGLRRLTALFIDLLVFFFIITIIAVFTKTLQEAQYFDYYILLYFISFSFIFKGKTPGLYYLKLKLTSTTEKFYRYQCSLRYIINFFLIYKIPLYLIYQTSNLAEKILSHEYKMYVLGLALLIYALFLFYELVLILFNKPLSSEKLSKTKIISVI